MMESRDIQKVVRDFIVNNFLFGDDGPLKEDTSFLDSGVVDSTGILELVSFLEERFGIRVEDEELLPENLDSLLKVTMYVEKKLGNQSDVIEIDIEDQS
ncbi:MAG: acyl carrier protein [Thermodesulfobacteriota bacterium]